MREFTPVEGLDIAIDGGVGTLTFNRPAKVNALTQEMWRGLPGVISDLDADPEVRAVILTGAGGNFTAGSDIADLAESLAEFWETNTGAEEALAAADVPTIAAIEGVCIGGGTELAAACDIRVAAPGSRFGIPAARLGLVYPPGPTRRLAEIIGTSWAKYLVLTGEIIDTDRAEELGFLHRVSGDAPATARELAGVIASRSDLTQTGAARVLRGEELDPGGWLAQAYAAELARGKAAFFAGEAPDFEFRRTDWR